MGRPKKERTVEAATGKGTFQQLLAQTKAELQVGATVIYLKMVFMKIAICQQKKM